MRIVVALLFLVLPCFGIGPVFSNYATQYTTSATNSFNVTATGTNLACVVVNFYRTTGSSGTPTCGGNAMTKACSIAFTLSYVGTADIWIYAGAGLSAGTIAVSIPSVVFESSGQAITISGANQSSTADSCGTLTNGTTTGVAGGSTGSQAFTTVANNAIAIGLFFGAVQFILTPSSNAILAGTTADGFAINSWYSSPNVTPAGAFSFLAKSSSGGGSSYQSAGISIAPPAPSYQQKARVLGFGH